MKTSQLLLLATAVNGMIGISASPLALAAGESDAELKAKIEARKKKSKRKLLRKPPKRMAITRSPVPTAPSGFQRRRPIPSI